MGMTPKYSDPDEMQYVIDAYFKECAGVLVKDEDGNIITDKYGKEMYIKSHPPTVTGMALALGFTSRQALINYQAKKAFVDTVTRAKTRIEAYTEERLFDRDGVQGAKFSLANNFKGWSEKTDVNMNISKTQEEAEAEIKAALDDAKANSNGAGK